MLQPTSKVQVIWDGFLAKRVFPEDFTDYLYTMPRRDVLYLAARLYEIKKFPVSLDSFWDHTATISESTMLEHTKIACERVESMLLKTGKSVYIDIEIGRDYNHSDVPMYAVRVCASPEGAFFSKTYHEADEIEELYLYPEIEDWQFGRTVKIRNWDFIQPHAMARAVTRALWKYHREMSH